ncbi:MAG TPA: LPS export ABC transporter periplasmic protein LptC [Bacteroidia bacterium]|nr:LPS export ABC transporter periplasmic protein LptC [Bacteroidia bacterium]
MHKIIFKKIIFSSCLLLLLSACENNISTVKIITSQSNLPLQTGKNVEIIYTDSAKLKVKLTSPEMNRFPGKSPYTECPKGVNVIFYSDSGTINSTLTSDYAIRYENTGKMEAKNDVVLVNKKGDKLNTEDLIWDQQKQIIYTNDFVKITTANEVIYGDGLQSNQSFTQYKILNITGTINLNNNE